MASTGLSSRTGRKSSPTSPTAPAPTSPGSWPETRWASSWLKATAAEAEFERSGDEGTSVRQEDVSELPGDQAQRRGARDLLEDAQTQTETRVMVGETARRKIPGSPRNRGFRGVETQTETGLG